MKAIYVITHANTSGPVNQALNILMGMKMNGSVEDTLVTIDYDPQKNTWLNRFHEAGINTYEMNVKNQKQIVKCVNLLRKYIINNSIDVVHCAGLRANLICYLAVGGKVPIISTQRSSVSDIAEKLPCYIRPAVKMFFVSLIKRIDCLVACSKSLQQTFFVENTIHTECVQNGVNTDFFSPVSIKRKEEIRRILNMKNITTFLILGSLRDRKNNALLIKAIKNLAPNFAGQFVFVGNGPEEKRLKEMAEGYSNIIFAGLTDKPIDYLQASDFLISCSLAEGLPNTVLEAISCGVVPILSDIEPHLELVQNTCIEHVFKRNSVEDLLNKLYDTRKVDISKESYEARQIAVNNFGITTLASNYEQIYKKIINSKK